MFEPMDLYNYKTGVLETNATHPCACSDAIFHCLTMQPVATLKIALRFRNPDRALLSSYTAQSLRQFKRTNHEGMEPSKKF